MATRLALDLHELDLPAGRERRGGIVATSPHRPGLIPDAVDEEHGHLERDARDRVADRVALGQLLGSATHQGAHRAVQFAVGTDDVAHARLGYDALKAYARRALDRAGGTRRQRRPAG